MKSESWLLPIISTIIFVVAAYAFSFLFYLNNSIWWFMPTFIFLIVVMIASFFIAVISAIVKSIKG